MLKKILFISLCIFAISVKAQTTINQLNGKVRLCKGKIKDSDKGKTTDHYDHNENLTMTICIPGAKYVKLKFSSSFCTEKDNDILRIFDGKDTFASLIGKWSGTTGPGTITSSDSCITLHFKSDKSLACEGWSADVTTEIIPPTKPILSLKNTVKCNATSFIVKSQVPLMCDSLKLANLQFTGANVPAVSSISAINCSGGKTQEFQVNLASPISINGTYVFKLFTRFKDFCDSIYEMSSTVNVSVVDCPLKVILKSDVDTVCKGSCTFLRATVSGGNPAKYVYSWTPSSLKGAGPQKVCPTINTRYILSVSDGLSVPSADTVDLVVIDPPIAQSDTEICYTNAGFNLRASPSGGTWYGLGITNAATGEFKPAGFYGVRKVWYKIGSCSDTVLVNCTAPWNLDNIMCPGKATQALWWYGPAGGTWSGPRVTNSGIFNPDTTPGTYVVKYTWKGCVSNKNVKIQNISVQRFDTTCQSRTNDTIQFSPYGIYPNYFVGLTNNYYGWYNPSQMSVGTTRVLWASGGCKDTTYITVLPIKAGPVDTFCPAAGMQVLKGFSPNAGYTWKGKGIVNPSKADYDPSFFFSLGKATYRDTLTIKSGRCTDRKFVNLIPTKINKKDTQFFCLEDTGKILSAASTQYFPLNGTWSGTGVKYGKVFKPQLVGYGAHKAYYSKNGCTDSVICYVRPKPICQKDTQICIDAKPFILYQQLAGGAFYGTGVANNATGLYNAAAAGKGIHTIFYYNKYGCYTTFKITIDTLPKLNFSLTPAEYCFSSETVNLSATPAGGIFSGPGILGNQFIPKNAGTGNFKLYYNLNQNACKAKTSVDVTVKDTLKISVTPKADTICPGENPILKASGKGGDKTNYIFDWSNGQRGASTFVTALKSTLYTVWLKDGCSDSVSASVNIKVNPRPYFQAFTSAPKCFGLNGWAKVKALPVGIYKYLWDISPPSTKDSITAKAGNSFRVTVLNIQTGCGSDTTILIPGFKSITADFFYNIPGGLPCLSNINPTLPITDASIGGDNGTWFWGDGSTSNYIPGFNPSHTYAGEKDNYTIKLKIQNTGGCTDSAVRNVCFRDTTLLFIPDGFTPDNDGLNDSFGPSGIAMNYFEMIIYNRWGQIIYSSKNPFIPWDGKHNGKPCPEGLYVYNVIYKSRKSALKQRSSTLLLARKKY